MSYEYAYYKMVCQTCGRKILVEVLLIGTNHNASIVASCAECLQKRKDFPAFKKFKKQHPQEAKDILAWAESR